MDIVIDEWVVHHLSTPDNRRAAVEFLEKVLGKCDRFVTIEGAGLDKKIWKMSKESDRWEPQARTFAKWFIRSFRTDSQKFLVISQSDAVPLPPDLEQETPAGDLFLVSAALTTGGFILTADRKLKERLSHRKEIAIRLLDEFLPQYDC